MQFLEDRASLSPLGYDMRMAPSFLCTVPGITAQRPHTCQDKHQEALACSQGLTSPGPVSEGWPESQMPKHMAPVPSGYLCGGRARRHPVWAQSLPSSLPGGGGVALTTAAQRQKLAAGLGTPSRVSGSLASGGGVSLLG